MASIPLWVWVFFGGSSWKTPKRPPENKLLQEWLDQELNGCWKERGRLGNSHLGGTLGNFRISLVVRIEAPCHKYLQGPQTYQPSHTFQQIAVLVSRKRHGTNLSGSRGPRGHRVAGLRSCSGEGCHGLLQVFRFLEGVGLRKLRVQDAGVQG